MSTVPFTENMPLEFTTAADDPDSKGIPVLDILTKRPWEARFYGRRIADLQMRVYGSPAETVHSDFRTECMEQIRAAHSLTDSEKTTATDILEQFPRERAFRHLDLHPGNVMVAGSWLSPRTVCRRQCDHFLLETAAVLVSLEFREGLHLSKYERGHCRFLLRAVRRGYRCRLKRRYSGRFPAALLDAALIPLLYLELNRARRTAPHRITALEARIARLAETAAL